MGFPGQISGGNLTNMRGPYSGRAFLLATPESIVFQAELPSLSGSYATVTYGAIQSGAWANIKPDMVYTITTTTTDFNAPTIRGYIREDAANATVVYIDEQDDTLSSGYFITVFDDYDIFPRKPRRAKDVNNVDYDKTFEQLPPTISGLQSVYVENTITPPATFAFAPTCTALAQGAVISSYLWDVGDGTITIGSTTTQNITVTFPDGHRWVSFTTTDDNAVSHTLHFEVYVGDLITSSFTLHGAEQLQWSGEFDGWAGSAPMFADVGSVVDNQRFTICVLATNNEVAGAINTNIVLIGRYRREATKTDGGDSKARNLQDSTLAIEGFGQSLSNLPIPKYNVTDKATPTLWNEITDPSPIRVIWHTLTRYTTAATVMSFDSLTADLVYQAGAIAVTSQGCLGALNQVLARHNARCNFSQDGTLRIRRDTNYINNRSGLVVIADIQTQDIASYELAIEYIDTVGQVHGGGLLYDPVQGDYLYFIAKAPTITSTIGEEVEQLNGQILDSTATAIQAATDLQERTASKLAQGRVVITMTLDLFDSWQFVEPSNYDRYNITIPATLNLRGKGYDTSDYWQLRSLSCNADIKAGTITPRAVFVQETTSGTAGRVVAIVPPASGVNIPLYPVLQPYSGAFNVDGLLFNPEDLAAFDDWEISPEAYQANDPKDANAIKPIPGADTGIYEVWLPSSGDVTTNFSTVINEIYTVTVYGSGVIASPNLIIPMLGGDGQGDSLPTSKGLSSASDPPAVGAGVYSLGQDRYDEVTSSLGGVCANIAYVIPTSYIDSVKSIEVSWVGTKPDIIPIVGDKNCSITLDTPGGDVVLGGPSFPLGVLDNELISITRVAGVGLWTEGLQISTVWVHGSVDRSYGGGGRLKIVKLDVTIEGIGERIGDAFYYQDFGTGEDNPPTEYASGNGLLIDGVAPTLLDFNSSHAYTFQITGTGNPLDFSYGDTDYDDNAWKSLTIKVNGPGATL